MGTVVSTPLCKGNNVGGHAAVMLFAAARVARLGRISPPNLGSPTGLPANVKNGCHLHAVGCVIVLINCIFD